MLDTTITIEQFFVPAIFTNNNSHSVKVDYSCICSIDLEGNIQHRREIYCFSDFDAFKICNSKYTGLVAILREAAAQQFQQIINAQIQYN